MSLGGGQSEPIHYDGLGAEVLIRLRDEILEGRWRDGDRIVEREVADRLGVSRGPIREALKQLESEGLVVLLPRRGARVASLTAEDAIEVLAIRSAIEPLAVELLLNRGDRSLLRPLEECVERLRIVSDDGPWSALVSLDMEFHELLYRHAGSKRLLRIWDSLRVPLLQTFRIHREFYDSRKTVFRSHEKLLSEIASGDVERAKAATHDHVLDLRPRLLHRLETQRAAPAADGDGES